MKSKPKKPKKAKKSKKQIPESELPKSVIRKRKRKHRWIKFLITLLILLALATLAFFMGWTHAKIEPNEVAVITNKIKKSKSFYKPDQFKWEWSGLIPGNIKIDIYQLNQQEFQLSKADSLPNGEFYGLFTDKADRNTFDYSLDIKLVYRIKESSLMSLIEDKQFFPIDTREIVLDTKKRTKQKPPKQITTQEPKKANDKELNKLTKERAKLQNEIIKAKKELKQLKEKVKMSHQSVESNKIFYTRFETNCTTQIFSYISNRSRQQGFVEKLSVNMRDIEAELKNLITTHFPYIELTALVVNELHIPDYDLYQTMKSLALNNIKIAPDDPSQPSTKRSVKQLDSTRQINSERMKALEELGEVLTKYPILLDYLKVHSSNDKTPDLIKLVD